MIERTPILNWATHLILLSGVLLLLGPIYLVFAAATQSLSEVNQVPANLGLSGHLWENIQAVWVNHDFQRKFLNTAVVASGIVIGKVSIACITAFGIVFFDYRLRMPIFWLIFITLMLPLEVRIVPTYAVAANALSPVQAILDLTGLSWVITKLSGIELALERNMLNSYTGLILPVIATATGTFLYRQFFLTIPDELVEAAKMDGAGPVRFLIDTLIPLSRTNMAALATIMFVAGWNQFLWPLLIVTDPDMRPVAVELRAAIPTGGETGGIPDWNNAMAASLMAMLPPIVIVILTQRWFVRGLINSDK